MNRSILIMAGGTGGHIFPALAVADLLKTRGWQVAWLGAPNSMEAELVPQHGYDISLVSFSGLRGKGWVRKLLLPFNLLVAMWQSTLVILRHRPDVVLGMGGYITFPGGLVATLLRRPLVVHEQNSIAGLSNKVLAKIATRVASGFPDVLPNAIWCGNPVRTEITSLPAPSLRFTNRTGKLNILVVGGSLGAAALNTVIPEALAMIKPEDRPNVIHQAGKHHQAQLASQYEKCGVVADVRAFIDDMSVQYSVADLVICRAGALTIAELAAVGVASILIPFPYAVDNHQFYNAQFLSDCGAAILLPQSELSAEKIAHLLNQLSRDKLLVMSLAARGQSKVGAACSVANICEEIAA